MSHFKTEYVNDLCCPVCRIYYDFSDVEPCYIHSFQNLDDRLYVGLCLDCRGPMLEELKSGKTDMAQCFAESMPFYLEEWFSTTSEVAMIVHNQNFSEALLQGHGLTPAAYDAVKLGNYMKLPFADLGIIVSWD